MLADDASRPEVDPYAPPAADLGRPATEVDRADVAEAEAIRRHHIAHEASIKALGGLNYIGAVGCGIGGVATVVLAFAPRVGDQQMGRGAAVGFGALLMLLAVLYGFLGRGLRRLRPWGRWLIVTLIGLGFLANFVKLSLDASGDLAANLGGMFCSSLIPTYVLFLMLSKKGQVVFSPAYKSVVARTPHVKMKMSIIVKVLGGLLLFVLGLMAIGVIFSLMSK